MQQSWINWTSRLCATPRPQCLLLTGPPASRPALVDLIACFTKSLSLMMCANVVTVSSLHIQLRMNSNEIMHMLCDGHWRTSGFDRQAEPSTGAVEQACSDSHVTWLNQRKVKSFYRGVVASDLRSGVNMLLQVRVTPLCYVSRASMRMTGGFLFTAPSVYQLCIGLGAIPGDFQVFVTCSDTIMNRLQHFLTALTQGGLSRFVLWLRLMACETNDRRWIERQHVVAAVKNTRPEKHSLYLTEWPPSSLRSLW